MNRFEAQQEVSRIFQEVYAADPDYPNVADDLTIVLTDSSAAPIHEVLDDDFEEVSAEKGSLRRVLLTPGQFAAAVEQYRLVTGKTVDAGLLESHLPWD